jgi:hypothetical protein
MAVQMVEPAPVVGAVAPAPAIATPAMVSATARPVRSAARDNTLARGDWLTLMAFLICALSLVALHLWDLIAGLFR